MSWGELQWLEPSHSFGREQLVSLTTDDILEICREPEGPRDKAFTVALPTPLPAPTPRTQEVDRGGLTLRIAMAGLTLALIPVCLIDRAMRRWP